MWGYFGGVSKEWKLKVELSCSCMPIYVIRVGIATLLHLVYSCVCFSSTIILNSHICIVTIFHNSWRVNYF